MALVDSLVSLTGTTAQVGNAWGDRPIRSVFFKPYTSVGDFAYRGITIVAAPIILAGVSIASLLVAGWQLLQAILQAIGSNFSTRWDTQEETSVRDKLNVSGGYALTAGICVVAAIISPFLNAIDSIGSAIVTVKNAISPAEAPSTMPTYS